MIEKNTNFYPRIPVFGDIHGNLTGLVNTVQFLQKSRGDIYPYVIQLGDFGYFPTVRPKKPRNDRELDVYRYLTIDSAPLGFKIIFIRGNHEDHNALKKLLKKTPEGLISCDSNGCLLYFPDGRLLNVQANPTTDITLAAFGGIERNSRPSSYEKNLLIAHSDESLDRLLDYKGIDVLLTHQGPDNQKKGGSTVRTLCELIQPKLHLYGHCHQLQYSINGNSKCYGLSKMPASKKPFTKSNDFYGILDLENLSFSPGALQPLNRQVI